MDVINEAAKRKCPNRTDMMGGFACAWTADNTLHTECPLCQGTGLRWPELSHQCATDGPHIHHLLCDGSGRIPDVTLEKVLNLLLSYGDVRFITTEGEPVHCFVNKHSFGGTGDTPMEAACAALLAT